MGSGAAMFGLGGAEDAVASITEFGRKRPLPLWYPFPGEWLLRDATVGGHAPGEPDADEEDEEAD
jgi:hypothetical protein